MSHAEKFLALVNDAKSRIEETTVEKVAQRLENGEELLLVDVREESEWERGRIPGAVHLGKGIIERDIAQIIPETDREIILYCGGGFRSALAADNLKKMGYKRPVSMDGGIRVWMQSGLPLEHD